MAYSALVRGSIGLAAAFGLVSSLTALNLPVAQADSPTETVVPAAPDYYPTGYTMGSAGSGGFIRQRPGTLAWVPYNGGSAVPVPGPLFGPDFGAGADVVATRTSTGVQLNDMDTGTTTSIPLKGFRYLGTYGTHVLAAVMGTTGSTIASLHVLSAAADGTVTDTPVTGWPAGVTIMGGTGAGDATSAVVRYIDSFGPTHLALLDLASGAVTPVAGAVPRIAISVLLTGDHLAWYLQDDTSVVHLASRSDPGGAVTTLQVPDVSGAAASGYGMVGDWLVANHGSNSSNLGGPVSVMPLAGGDMTTLLDHADPAQIRTGPTGVLVLGGSSSTDWAVRRLTVGSDGTPTATTVDADPATPSPVDGLSLAGGTLFTVERNSTVSGSGFTRTVTLGGSAPAYGPHTEFAGTWVASNCYAEATCVPPIGTGDGRISQLWAASGGDKVTVQRGSAGYLVVPSATGGTLVDADGRYVVYDGGSPHKQYIGDTDAPDNSRVLFSRPVSAAALSGSTLWTAGTMAGSLSQTDLTTRKTVQTVATGAPCVPSELQAAASRWVYWSCGSGGPAGVWDLAAGKDISVPSAGLAQLGDGFVVEHDRSAGTLELTDVHTDTAVTTDLAALPAGTLTDDRRVTWAVDKYDGGIAYLDAQENIHLVDPHVPASTPAPATGTEMMSGQILPAGHSLSSNSVTLTMGTDGNLAVYLKTGGSGTGPRIWASNTSGHAGAYAVMQADGNLVVYSADRRVLWSTGTNGNSGAYTALQDDGNLVVHFRGSTSDALWSTGSYARSRTIASGQTLKAGWWTQATYTRLVMQPDGNLVMYRRRDGKTLWSSRTSGHAGAYAVMQAEGNLVVYGAGKRALWSTRTSGNSHAYTVMQNDGNLVVYRRTGGTGKGGSLWASNTSHDVP